MIFTWFLTSVFLFMAIYSLVFVRRILIRYALLFLYASAIFFVWCPDATTIIAQFFGIGRGLDFMLVLFSVTIINGSLFIIRYLNAQHQNITKLTRFIALGNPYIPKSNKP